MSRRFVQVCLVFLELKVSGGMILPMRSHGRQRYLRDDL